MMDHLDPIAAGQVDAVVGLVRETLGDAVAGCYLFGSAVRGGLRPDSDLEADDPWDEAGKALARADADAMLAAIAPGA